MWGVRSGSPLPSICGSSVSRRRAACARDVRGAQHRSRRSPRDCKLPANARLLIHPSAVASNDEREVRHVAPPTKTRRSRRRSPWTPVTGPRTLASRREGTAGTIRGTGTMFPVDLSNRPCRRSSITAIQPPRAMKISASAGRGRRSARSGDAVPRVRRDGRNKAVAAPLPDPFHCCGDVWGGADHVDV